ncbi:Hcp family type VI secretion system effector [Citrobacter sp. RHBSTW-00671]|uniref:Hcp family type VI secretion system effector n=1 Tax=Citrobacter sp. RHBSTW-00671 TaxID=2742660 RepID=UPI0018444F8A|nr:Hcp family type VI secretion system effector [Citrobacter sp. RHBSTW-00671]MBA7966551.1 Hcp family type VI secretion system effector [Citrobacter sp. RHBSTW-00671]HCJ6373903.1 Hcp family type VI secretion system effector [Citrobacter freundii]
MPMPCYMTLEGVNQGKIEGSSEVSGHEGKILIQAVDHLVDIPKNPQTGLPAGKRIHQGMTLTKEIDKSSPKLFQALASGEQLKNVTLEFYRISPKGMEEKYYTIMLENAVLVSARTWVPNVLVPENKQIGQMEDLVLTYERIVWTWLPDGIEAEDSWLAPKA